MENVLGGKGGKYGGRVVIGQRAKLFWGLVAGGGGSPTAASNMTSRVCNKGPDEKEGEREGEGKILSVSVLSL